MISTDFILGFALGYFLSLAATIVGAVVFGYNKTEQIEITGQPYIPQKEVIKTIPTEKPTWFAHDPEGSVITPDNSDLFDRTDTLKELLGEE